MGFLKRYGHIHPNGFWIYLVKVFKNKSRIRFHFWPRGVDRLDSPHDHRTWFISLPLWGTFVEKRFLEVPGRDKEVLLCHATASGGNGKPITHKIGKGSVEQITEHRRFPLIPYFCDVNTIHSFLPAKEGPAASIVLFGPPKNASCLGRPRRRDQMIIRTTFKTPDAVRYALDEEFGDEPPATTRLNDRRSRAEQVLRKFIQYGECVAIEFDTEKGTARVLEAR